MNLGSCLLAVLALAVLSAEPAVAGHRSHGVHDASSHRNSRMVRRGVETSRTSTIGPRDSGPQAKGTVADQSKGGSAKDGSRPASIDKANGDDESLHARKSGVATPGSGVSSKDGADVPIDTRISVNQGRGIIKGFGKHRFGNSIVNAAAGGKRQHIVDRHQGTPIRPAGDRRRNSIGTVVDHDKAATEHRNAAGVAVIPTNAAGVESKVGPVPPASGAAIHEANATSSTSNAPIKSPVATQPDREKGTIAPVAAATNGASIDGTGMIRPAARIAAIGGPARVTPGVLSGNSFRPKHP